ncbi:unnamed protein product [Urochloa decumbens]|uniref:PDZ domain-containing protein n=1 Tax=Urochloa decumbens TaxID=240449 RepID=A0ABC9B2M1_9POAL
MDSNSTCSSEPVTNACRVVPCMDAVVKVFCVHTESNFSLPWQQRRQSSSIGSGVIVSGRRVLTNAHCVEHHTQVKLKRRDSDTKFLATVLAMGRECDIALLTVSDDEFWEGVLPVEFGALPALQDAVTVVGYPIGGDTISVTSGVVSRIQTVPYSVLASSKLLGLQIDAAINYGNSGGPAYNDRGKCVGLAFRKNISNDADNIGYVIPTPVITHFIEDYEKSGEYTGFPTLGIKWQKMENPDLRNAMGMKLDQKGVLVKRVEPTSPASGCLQPSDVILSFDGVDIGNDGTGHLNGRPPSYYIVAGIVFAAVSVPYLRSEYGKNYEHRAPAKLVVKHLHALAESPDEQLVVISQVLAADINTGYEDISNSLVVSFNGQPVKNLKNLVTIVENCKDKFLKFGLEFGQIVILETKTAKAATKDILTARCIPSAMSDDLKA